MAKKKEKVEFRYYEIPEKDLVLALLGEEWIRSYGEGIDYLHFHNYMEIGICHYGMGEVVLDEKHYRFADHSMVIIPPKLPHTTNADAGTSAYWEWMYFDMETVLEEMYPQDGHTRQRVSNEINERACYLTAEDQPFLDSILALIAKECSRPRYQHRESVKGLLQTFAVELQRINKAEEQMNRRKKISVVIAPAIEYTEVHYHEDIKISELADICNISESHFRRVFLENMNMRPLDFVNLIRIKKACILMKKKSISMEDIAYQTGFENMTTFNRNFKRFLDMTPYQWKKSAENYEGKLLNYHISAQKGW